MLLQEEEFIPFRTRSKYPLTDHSILEFEANFVAPDISEDMYDSTYGDHDWKEFLMEFTMLQQDCEGARNNPTIYIWFWLYLTIFDI